MVGRRSMKSVSCAHLNVHSALSLGTAFCRIPALVERARRLGFRSLALTDSGNLFGALEFSLAARTAGIRPIIGCEVQLAPALRRGQRALAPRRPDQHSVVLLASNPVGYRNLIWLVTHSHLRSAGSVPQVRCAWLAEHSDGLIAMAGGRRGGLRRAVVAGNLERADTMVAFLAATFGRDNLFMQIERGGLRDDREGESAMLSLAHIHRLRCVATTDVRFLGRADRPALEFLCALRAEGTRHQPASLAEHDGASHLLSAHEMERLFHDLPEALENTDRIAARCDLDLVETARQVWPDDRPETIAALAHSVARGLRRCYRVTVRVAPDGRVLEPSRSAGSRNPSPQPAISTPDIVRRANTELDAVHSSGLTRFFCELSRLGRALGRQGIPSVLRGSGNGSLLAHALGLTVIDPLRHGLAWEPALATMAATGPAVGIEVPDDQHQQVVELLRKTRSADRVGSINTFRRLHPQTLCEHLGRWGDLPGPIHRSFMSALQDGLARQRRHPTGWHPFEEKVLAKAAGEGGITDLRQRRQVKQLTRIAWLLRDLPWEVAEQEATVVVGAGPLIEGLPLRRGRDGTIAVQFPLPEVAELGCYKVSLVGCEMLRRLKNAVQDRQVGGDRRFSLSDLPSDGSGDLVGILRKASVAMPDLLCAGERELALRLGARSLADFALALAVHSPLQSVADSLIARRRGVEPCEPPHPLLADILRDTCGLFVFREQQLEAIQLLTGWSALEAVRWHLSATGRRAWHQVEAAFTSACWNHHRLAKPIAQGLSREIRTTHRWQAELTAKGQLACWLSRLRSRCDTAG